MGVASNYAALLADVSVTRPRITNATQDEAFGAIAALYVVRKSWRSIDEVHALAKGCENDRTAFTKAVKKIVRERFGVKVSARGSTGTGYSWVRIAIGDNDNTPEAHAVIRAMRGGDGVVYRSELVSGRCGERFATICALAGHPTPAGFTIAPRDWD